MSKKSVVFALLLLALASVPAFAADFSPFTLSPSVTDVPDDGYCIKGRFECRWGGSCEKRGDKCYSCIEDYTYHDSLGCYRCSEGTSLVERNGEWRCIG